LNALQQSCTTARQLEVALDTGAYGNRRPSTELKIASSSFPSAKLSVKSRTGGAWDPVSPKNMRTRVPAQPRR
jgi:hypothetical protein